MSRKKILLAEDDIDDQVFFHSFLHERQDILLLPPVENGEDLLEYLENISDREELPDIIVLDQNMPKLNGLQTLRILKSSGQYAHITVMIYSTYADENLIKQSMDSGAALVKTKPTSMEGYNRIIDELFKMQRV